MAPLPLKVLFLTESLAGGGAERVLADLVCGLDKERFDITVCTIVDCGVYRDEVRRSVRYKTVVGAGGWLYRLKYALVYRFLPPSWIYNWRVSGDYDVEIAFTEGFPTRILASSGSNVARVAWVHMDLEANPWTQGIVYSSLEQEKNAYSRFGTVIHVSKTVQEAFHRRFGQMGQSLVLLNPVDERAIRAKSEEQVSLPEKRFFRLVTVGRLEKAKGYDRLIKGLAGLQAKGLRAELVILGEGSCRKDLERLAEELGVAGCVRMPGFVKNPYPWVKSADLFVCSSRSEGMSTVVTESLVLGVPVLATECSGIQEQLGGGRFGYIVENGETALAQGLEAFVSGREDISVWRQRAEAGGREVSCEKNIRAVEHLLEGLS